MPIQQAIWTVGDTPTLVPSGELDTEQRLEEMIVRDSGILSNEWMLIGRQVVTRHNGRVDLLAIAPDASLILIELKRDRTPREIVAQALDYASWVQQLAPEQISEIYRRFSNGGSLDEDFRKRFGVDLDEAELNRSHQIIIVAAKLDDATERIVDYLHSKDVPINVVFFQVFEHGGEKLLSRVWLIDPSETQISGSSSSGSRGGDAEPWNGEYYVSFGTDGDSRSWEDARNYGYVSGGGGSWYSQTLKLLSVGDRIWVNIPKTGYVGVGRVTHPVVPVKEFKVETSSGERYAMDVLRNGERYREHADNSEMAEYFVRVQWLEAVPEANAFREIGLFGNQNTVCRPTTPKWRNTVERLKQRFSKWDESIS